MTYETDFYEVNRKANDCITITPRTVEAENLLDENLFSLMLVDQRYDFLLAAYNNMSYKAYLLTKHWQYFKISALKHFNRRCQACGSEDKKLNVHHNNYNSKGCETFDDVTVLCEECHAKFHNKNEEKGKGKTKVTIAT